MIKTMQFGLLVRALRETLLDDDYRELTREGLSDLIYNEYNYVLTADAIGKIERGERSRFELEELFALADAFHLNTAEREKFILTSTGVTDEQICRDSSDPEFVINDLITYTKDLRLPWIIMDQYCDVLYVNPAIIRLFRLEENHIAELMNNPIGFNLFSLLLSPNMPYQSILVGAGRQDLFDEYVFTALFYFRKNTFQSRTTPYFKHLFNHLRKIRLFRIYWEDLPLQKRDYNGTGIPYEYEDPEFGHLRYVTLQNQLLTKAGSITVLSYASLTKHTSEVFEKITNEVGPGVIPFAPWYDKHIPEKKRS